MWRLADGDPGPPDSTPKKAPRGQLLGADKRVNYSAPLREHELVTALIVVGLPWHRVDAEVTRFGRVREPQKKNGAHAGHGC
jgi:hypothetical protein